MSDIVNRRRDGKRDPHDRDHQRNVDVRQRVLGNQMGHGGRPSFNDGASPQVSRFESLVSFYLGPLAGLTKRQVAMLDCVHGVAHGKALEIHPESRCWRRPAR
jgi:hypothetical protein